MATAQSKLLVRPCPFCGVLPLCEYTGEGVNRGYIVGHPPSDCIGAAVYALGDEAASCANQWNARATTEYQWKAVLDAIAHCLLSQKPEAARTILRRAINNDVGDDATCLREYWQGWLVEPPITTQLITPAVPMPHPRPTPLFA